MNASTFEPWIFYPDLTCRTACALCRHSRLKFPSPLFPSFSPSSLNDCISKQTPTDHPWCLLSSLSHPCLPSLCAASLSSLLSPLTPIYTSPAGPLPQPYLASSCQTSTTVQRQQPHPWSMSSVWCSPQHWDKQSLAPQLFLAHQYCPNPQFEGHPRWNGQKRRKEQVKNTLRENISISASLHASSCTPPPPPLHPSSVHSLRDGFTFCPRSQALRHR